MSARPKQIPQEVLQVLGTGRAEGCRFFLGAGQLDRKLYTATNDVLDALGGKWNRGAKAHVFSEDCAELIDAAIDSGSYTRPADMGWFPTQPALAERVARLAQIQPGMLVLEPSAGEGALCTEAMKLGAVVQAYELDRRRADRCQLIAAVTPVHADFLMIEPEPRFDRVLMNPPFAKRADIHHVLHARRFLKPGGLLVAIMSGGVLFREDAIATSLRDQVETLEALPDGSFSSSGTEVRTAIVTMRAKYESGIDDAEQAS